ncbi:unnamed protein product [Acanthoscelides obtectus]|uniref:Uncharacterized protein n=1 Tax=Acanthoscelides obtectus TaxID=200917 RepID=A0A9P0PNY7_ACAOB|nr:unnamed protein product [Acanthoscelides obtectus]CAK1680661.1 hypothetical protein AOBTE_LOCUS32828 [Acanthoscelides obtectus]
MAEMMNLRNMKYYKPRRTPRTSDFKSMFRFEEENVKWLAQNFLGESVERRGGAISALHRMKVCLRYLANPGFQSGIGEERLSNPLFLAL